MTTVNAPRNAIYFNRTHPEFKSKPAEPYSAPTARRDIGMLNWIACFLLLCMVLSLANSAHAQAVFSSTGVNGGGTVVPPATTVNVAISGNVQASQSADAINEVDLYQEGKSTPLARQTYTVAYDRFSNPVNTQRYFNLTAALPPGTYRLHVGAWTETGGEGDSQVFTVTVAQNPAVLAAVMDVLFNYLFDDDPGTPPPPPPITTGNDGSGDNVGANDTPAGSPNGSVISATPLPVAIAPPHLTNNRGGTLPGSLSVGNDGAAAYSIPLAVPPGTAGMAPQLSLNYSSNGSNAQQGLGWSLGGLSTIHRCAKTIAQDGVAGRISFDTADRLCLDGQRLLRADGDTTQDASYWAAGAQYRTEIEGFSRITRLANNGFQVEGKDGRIRFYGVDANSAIAAQGRTDGQPLLWGLSTVQDRSGNYMSVHYFTAPATGEYIPDLIRYGGNTNAGTAPDLSVKLTYVNRTDWQPQYMGGSSNDLRSLLSHVQAYIGTAADGSGGTLARDYKITYTTSATSGRSLLSSVQASALSSTGKLESLPPTTFTYGSSDAPKVVLKSTFDLNVLTDGEDAQIKSYVGDFDGSGISTIVAPIQDCKFVGCHNRTFNGRFVGRTGDGGYAGITLDLSQVTGAYTEALVGDMNGDGRDDMVLLDAKGRSWAYCISQPPSQPGSLVFAPCQTGGTLPAKRTGSQGDDLPSLVSIDNDGLAKLMYFDAANQAHVCSYNGGISCRVIPTSAPANVVLGAGLIPVELSKQGQSDFYSAYPSPVVCRQNKGTMQCESLPSMPSSNSSLGAGDLNGDGLTDFSTVGICLSKETGVNCLPIASHGYGVGDPEGVGFGYFFAGISDVLGDGVSRYWGYTNQQSVCRWAGDHEVCQAVDLTGIPADTVAVINGADSYSLPMTLDGSGVPGALNCRSMPTLKNGSYYQTCWLTSTAISPNQDRLISVTNGVGHTAEVDYARGDDAAVYSRFTKVAGVEQRPSYPQMATSPGVMVKQLRQATGQGNMLATNYHYEGAMRDANGRGSLGFALVQATDAQTGITSVSRLNQAFPFIGMAMNASKSAGNCVLESVTNTPAQQVFSMPGGAQNIFTYTAQSDAVHRDIDFVDNTCYDRGTASTVNQYNDGWGNLNVQTATITSGGDSFRTVTTTSFMTGGGQNFLSGLPTSVSISKSVNGGAALTRTVTNTYDSITTLRRTETTEPGNSQLSVLTTYDRSANKFGLVNVTTQSWTNPACAATGWPEAGCVSAMSRKVSDITYDAMGRFPVTVKNALNQAETHVYDASTGARTSLTGPNGLTTTWQVDGFGRVTKELRADGNETRAYFKKCNGDCPANATVAQITEHFHGNDRIAVPQVVYADSAGHVVRTMTWGFNGLQSVADQRYDERGRPFETDQPRFIADRSYLASRQVYDNLNRVTAQVSLDEHGAEHSTTMRYQGANRVLTNLLGQQRTEQYNAVGQLSQVTDPANGVTKFEYEPFGNLTKTTDPSGNVINVRYDNLGRKIQLQDPDLGQIDYDVDPIGQTWAQRSPKQRAAGQKTYMAYDLLGRMTARYETDLESHWVFDTATKGVGQLAEAYTGTPSNKDYRRLESYDSQGRPDVTTQYLSSIQYTSQPGYDVWSRVISSTYKRGTDAAKVFSNRYNNTGYLARIDRGTLALWQVTAQDAASRLTGLTLGNGLTQTRSYDPNTARQSDAQLVQGTTLRLKEGYTYDLIGNMQQRTQYWDAGGFIEGFTYDNLNRLHTSQVTGQSELVFTYDAVGNLSSKTGVGTYVYGGAQPHAVQSITGIGGFSYDANGNLTSGAGRVSCWTSFDMPAKIAAGGNASDCSGGSTLSAFVYGPEHQRTRQIRVDGSATTTIVYAGAQEVETSSAGTTVKTYWPGGIGVEIDRPGASATELNWTHVDRLGSVIAITDQNGVMREKLEYDAWGKRRSVIDNNSTANNIDGVTDNKGFTGHEMLDQLDLVHMNGRVYDPLIGKFMSGDPLIQDPQNGQNYNRYSYVVNNPTNMTDPTGFSMTMMGGGDWTPMGSMLSYGDVEVFGKQGAFPSMISDIADNYAKIKEASQSSKSGEGIAATGAASDRPATQNNASAISGASGTSGSGGGNTQGANPGCSGEMQCVNVPGRRITDPVEARGRMLADQLGYPTYNYLNERFHSYGYARPLCSLAQRGCSVANASPGFRCNAGPGQPGCALPGTKNVWPLLFNSHIVQEMSGDQVLAVNLTMPDHPMRDGIVVRWLGVQDGNLMSYTYGEGVNTSVFKRDANQLAGWALFKMADMQLQQQLELKIRETPQK